MTSPIHPKDCVHGPLVDECGMDDLTDSIQLMPLRWWNQNECSQSWFEDKMTAGLTDNESIVINWPSSEL